MKSTIKRAAAAVCTVVTMTGMAGCNTAPADVQDTQAPETSAAGTAGTAAAASSADYDKTVIRVDGNRFTVDGKTLFINGVNTPWDKWNDFGGAFNETFWDEHFAKLHESGVNASRIWINCAGISTLKVDKDGILQSVSGKHWTDLDKLFELAEKHHIYIMATLLSFDHFKDSNAGYENFRTMVSSEEGTQSYIDGYVIPFTERYGKNPYLWSIDLCNEPDWIKENAECGKIDWDVLCTFFARCAAAIHDNSDELVTVGLGMIKYTSDKYDGNYFSDEYLGSLAGESAYLDYDCPHYYYWQYSYMGYPFETTPAEFGLTHTKPAVIGEFAVLSESGRTCYEDYENAYNNGWNGLCMWTSNGVDGCGSIDDAKGATEHIAEIAHDEVFPLGDE
ncbi:MAG: cellulase (glycosyl hydrolase family 5) [Oscillospiraceae bacterium]|nr:cellulase (glycosyl hydrolase family 5) [Oscillospiraceae bacterium]